MSLMPCADCGLLVDTDDDPESLYAFERLGRKVDCLCETCRESMEETAGYTWPTDKAGTP